MSDNVNRVYGISAEEWEAAYRAGIEEFPAYRFIAKIDQGIVRIAFGNSGPPLDETGSQGCPAFSHAVTLTPGLAIELARVLRDLLAGPPNNVNTNG